MGKLELLGSCAFVAHFGVETYPSRRRFFEHFQYAMFGPQGRLRLLSAQRIAPCLSTGSTSIARIYFEPRLTGLLGFWLEPMARWLKPTKE